MVRSSMQHGKVIDAKGHDYLVLLADGSTMRMRTDDGTLGNGPAYPGEDILAWLEKDDRISVLTRVVWAPMISQFIAQQ